MGVYKMLVLNCQKMLEINCHFLLESTCRLQFSIKSPLQKKQMRVKTLLHPNTQRQIRTRFQSLCKDAILQSLSIIYVNHYLEIEREQTTYCLIK